MDVEIINNAKTVFVVDLSYCKQRVSSYQFRINSESNPN